MTTKEKILSELARVNRDGMPELIEYLKRTDYFTAPASAKYHLSVPGGLAKHSWHVYEKLHQKNNEYHLDLCVDTVRICGLLHDLCKVGLYVPEKKNRKVNGKWISENGWGYDEHMPLGHGEKSVIVLQKFIKLTDNEIYMIRWHMGGFVGESDARALSAACGKCPAIVAMHTADYEATWYVDTKYEEELI